MHFVEFTADIVKSLDKPKTKRVVYPGNPILNGHFIHEDCYVGCGFDNVPLVFKKQGDGSWKFEGSLDPGFNTFKKAVISGNAFQNQTAFFEGYEMTADLKVQPRETLHQNQINYSQPYVTSPDGKVQVLSTCDVNGSICYWDCTKL